MENKVETNSIGMKLVLIPKGEFMMGNGHKAEDELKLLRPYYDVMTVKFFDCGTAPPRPDHKAVPYGGVSRDRGPVPAVRKGQRVQDRGGRQRRRSGRIRPVKRQGDFLRQARMVVRTTSGSSKPRIIRCCASVGTTPSPSASG